LANYYMTTSVLYLALQVPDQDLSFSALKTSSFNTPILLCVQILNSRGQKISKFSKC
jgi:hypothetical protein